MAKLTKEEIEELLKSQPHVVWTDEVKELARQIYKPDYAAAFVFQIQAYRKDYAEDPDGYCQTLMAWRARQVAQAAVANYVKTEKWPQSFDGMTREEIHEITGRTDDPLTDDQEAKE